MRTRRLYQIGIVILVMTSLSGCDRPLPTEVSQVLTEAAPTLDALMGTATTIAGQIAATLAEVQIPTDIPLTAEAYVQDLSMTAAALVLPTATEIPAAEGTPNPVPATPAAVYPASAVQAEESATSVPTAKPQAENAISDTPAVIETATIEVVIGTAEVIGTETVAATEVVTATESVTGPEMAVETESMAETAAAAATESVYLGVIQSGTGVSETLTTETAVVEMAVTEAPVTEVVVTEVVITESVVTQAPVSQATPVPAQETPAANLPLITAPESQEAPVGQESEITELKSETSDEYQLVIPEIYTLKRGEFPYCLARRFDIHPRKLMNVNGFFEGQRFYPGQKVIIPASSRAFPGERALRYHPNTYRVSGRETIYSIACYYGDIDPLEIAWLNGLTSPYKLFNGQILTLP